MEGQESEPKIGDQADHQQPPAAPDETPDSITKGVRSAAAWIDAFLSDERSRAEENHSWMSLRLDDLIQQHASPDTSFRVDGRLILPQMANRLRLAFEGQPEAADETATPANPPPVDAAGKAVKNPDLALEYVLKESRSDDIRPELGVRFRELEADPFAGVRWRHTEPLGTWVLNTTERLRSYADAGPESRTTVDWNHIILERLLLRASTRGIWRDQATGFEYGQRFTFFQTLDGRTVLAYDWDTSFDTSTEQEVTESVLSVRLSRRVARNQVLLEIAPQIAWRQDLDYEPALGLFLRIEMSFGRE